MFNIARGSEAVTFAVKHRFFGFSENENERTHDNAEQQRGNGNKRQFFNVYFVLLPSRKNLPFDKFGINIISYANFFVKFGEFFMNTIEFIFSW